MNGVLILDKPQGFTSHDAVARMRRIAGEKSIGHLGTLDPMATGVLPLVLGKLTRLAQFYTGAEKVYEGRIRFGFATNTYDAEGEKVGDAVAPRLNVESVREAAAAFAGVIQQAPPPFSAKKVAGVPAYRMARAMQDVVLEPVTVEIKEFTVTDYEEADHTAGFRAQVSSGTYVRSLANDLGERLGCGAHLAGLRRTRVAEFNLDVAVSLQDLGDDPAKLQQHLIHPRQLLPEFPSVTATEEQVAFIRNGRPLNLPDYSNAKWVKVFAGQSELACMASRVAGTLFQPKVVLL